MVSSHWQACDVRTIAFAAVGSLSLFPKAHLRHRLGTSTLKAEDIGPESSRHPVVPSSRHPVVPSSRRPAVSGHRTFAKTSKSAQIINVAAAKSFVGASAAIPRDVISTN